MHRHEQERKRRYRISLRLWLFSASRQCAWRGIAQSANSKKHALVVHVGCRRAPISQRHRVPDGKDIASRVTHTRKRCRPPAQSLNAELEENGTMIICNGSEAPVETFHIPVQSKTRRKWRACVWVPICRRDAGQSICYATSGQ